MNIIRLKYGRKRSLPRRRSWLFEGAIDSGSADSDETVRIESHAGQFLGWDAFSQSSRSRLEFQRSEDH